jgi:hypothetical protein
MDVSDDEEDNKPLVKPLVPIKIKSKPPKFNLQDDIIWTNVHQSDFGKESSCDGHQDIRELIAEIGEKCVSFSF